MKAGDTIWWFSQLAGSGGRLPPSLDARIEVAEVVDAGNGRRCFEAGPGSCWFPLWDARALLPLLPVRSATGVVCSLMSSEQQAVGQALRFIRELQDPLPIHEHVRSLAGISHDFVSYRIHDGTPMAFQCVAKLLEEGRSVFWDRWSLPRRLAERGEQIDPTALEGHIEVAIHRARTVWGVRSAGYGEEDSVSRLEMRLAEALGKFRPWPSSDHQ